MKQLVMTAILEMDVVDGPPVVPEPGEVVITVDFCGVCGTDLHGISGQNGRRHPGQVMGHEGAGTVTAIADDVEVRLGSAVTFNPLLSCGSCQYCLQGRQQRCESRKVVGVDHALDGAFREQIALPVSAVHLLPEGMSTLHGALVEPLAVAIHAIAVAGDIADKRVLVLGGGPIGQSLVIAAIDSGAREVYVSEPVAGRRQICERLGGRALHPELLRQSLSDTPPDVVIDAVGLTSSVRDGLSALRPGGVLVLVGMGSPDLQLSAYDVTVTERTIRGSYCYSNNDFSAAVRLMDERRDIADIMISTITHLTEAPEMIRQLLQTAPPDGKAMIDLRFSDGTSPVIS